MAITNIEIVQDNIVGDCDLLSVASPLVYLVNATYTGAVPDVIYARLFDGATDLGYYKCLPWKDLSSAVRQFWFKADEILRQYVPLLEDVAQSDNTLIEISGAVKGLTLKFANEYRDDLGYCIKEGKADGAVISGFNYNVIGSVIINGIGIDIGFTILEPMTLTDAYMIERYKEQLNINAPGALDSSIFIYDTAFGYAIRNNTTSDTDKVQMFSIAQQYQLTSVPTPAVSAFTNFHAINAAGQVGETEANLPVFNNEQQSQIGIAGKHAYAYFYSADPTGTLSVTESSNDNYEMVATNDGVVTGLTASQVSTSVVKYELAAPGTGNVAFGASGVFETLSIKIDEILGTFSGSANKIELTYLNNGTVTVDIDALGVGTHTFNLNTAFPTSNVKLFIIGDTAEAKSISLDFVRLTSTEITC